MPRTAQPLGEFVEGRPVMKNWLKIACMAAAIAGASYFFGKTCARVEHALPLILSPSQDSLDLLVALLLAMGLVVISIELAAALVRPLLLGASLFALGGLAMLLAGPLSGISALLSLVFFLGATLYAWRAKAELDNRISFSAGVLAQKQGILLVILIFVASARIYLGSVQYFDREGFSIPPRLARVVASWMEGQIGGQIPPEERERALAQLRRDLPTQMQAMLNRLIAPYEPWMPILVSLGFFMTLETLLGFLGWIPARILRLLIALLALLKVTREVVEMREVRTLSL